MANLSFDAKGGFDVLAQKLKSPFDRFKNAEALKEQLRLAHARNDFKNGFTITPFNKDGVRLPNDIVYFLADAMPKTPFTFGGEQRIVKDYYPGSSEPTVQVLGPIESDITINGRLKAKRIKLGPNDNKETFRKYPQFVQEQVEAIRVAGLLVFIQLGDWSRWGFIQNATFEMRTLADIDYSITFLIVGFNKPKDYIIVENIRQVPVNKNKELARRLAKAINESFGKAPESMPKSFAEQINQAISDVAAAVNLVTGFVDTVLGEVDSIKASVQRAIGLVKNARNSITRFQRVIGGQNPEAGFAKKSRVNGAYANAAYVAQAMSSMNDINALMASLVLDLRKITLTVPLARHRVISGDTLQNIAMKYYNDSSKWGEIYDHNKLLSTDLDIGTILEIPRS